MVSLMSLGFLNVTTTSLLVNGLDPSNSGQYLEVTAFIGKLPLVFVVINIQGVSSFLPCVGVQQ